MTQGRIPVNAGDLLAGKYRVEGVLGMGGMGIVVSARHEELDQRVAIKFVRPEALGNRDAVERFLREARAAAKLKSEHAAKVLDVGRLESGAPYMVMELLEGRDLGQVLREHGPLPVEQAVDWIVQACEAVAEAHAAGIVHRDLKPQNLFLARSIGNTSRVKVLDFGVSKSIGTIGSGDGALTQTQALIGSPLYMSPEHMRSSRGVDARSDVWALGVVLFELLTGRRPFECATLTELCLMVVSDPPISLRHLRPDAPQGILEVVERCLQKDPADRFRNAAELALALEPFANATSQVAVQRAQMAMAAKGSQPALGEDFASVRADREPAPIAARGPTPSAWGSGRHGGRVGHRRRRAGLWAVAAIVTLVGVVACAWLGVRTHFVGHAAVVAPSSSVVVSAAPLRVEAIVPPAAKAEPNAPPILIEPPMESSSAQPADSGPPPRPSAPWTRAAPVPAPPAPKPPARDDDIPALR